MHRGSCVWDRTLGAAFLEIGVLPIMLQNFILLGNGILVKGLCLERSYPHLQSNSTRFEQPEFGHRKPTKEKGVREISCFASPV